VDRRCTARQPQHRRVYCLDRDYDDFLQVKRMSKVNEARRSLTQNSEWKVEWNNNVAGVHRSVTEREMKHFSLMEKTNKGSTRNKEPQFFVHSPNGKMFNSESESFHLGFVQMRRSYIEFRSKDLIRVGRGQHFPKILTVAHKPSMSTFEVHPSSTENMANI
jgi:hypothetical protein